ncbi:hypothetical protein HGA88_05355 [Candidatus Roizmanbacteria bacterium]|nr:hypothetical protein [Candidatus Roizmanbacteria bacterium]
MKLPSTLTTATPLSKGLAMVLFILLPFVGFYLGMKYNEGIQTVKITQYSEKNDSKVPSPIYKNTATPTINKPSSVPKPSGNELNLTNTLTIKPSTTTMSSITYGSSSDCNRLNEISRESKTYAFFGYTFDYPKEFKKIIDNSGQGNLIALLTNMKQVNSAQDIYLNTFTKSDIIISVTGGSVFDGDHNKEEDLTTPEQNLQKTFNKEFGYPLVRDCNKPGITTYSTVSYEPVVSAVGFIGKYTPPASSVPSTSIYNNAVVYHLLNGVNYLEFVARPNNQNTINVIEAIIKSAKVVK